MRGLGLHCNFQQGRPRVVAVIVERDPRGALHSSQAFSHLADAQEDLPLQLANLKSAVASHLQPLPADAAVVRAMDYFGNTSRELIKRHSLVVGVLVAEARGRYELTRLLSGREAAAQCGTTKQDLEDQATVLSGAALKEAGSAALAALHVAENP